jgi:hypothetical protein
MVRVEEIPDVPVKVNREAIATLNANYRGTHQPLDANQTQSDAMENAK